MNLIRLNKYLAECGVDSRRGVEELITGGRVLINGEPPVSIAAKINRETDVVTVDGEKVKPLRNIYYLLNKPRGTICASKDLKGKPTVVDLINSKIRLFPVGRLDFNTTGALIITNDGQLAYFLLHPKFKVPRVYEVKLDKPLRIEDEQKLLQGITIEQKLGNFESVEFQSNNRRYLDVLAIEGRNHFIKNMFSSLGYIVTSLHRKSFAGFSVQNIALGQYRQMTPIEIKELYKKYGTKYSYNSNNVNKRDDNKYNEDDSENFDENYENFDK
ncbi:MAG: rRNA pseudouridine synthase [Chlorobiaceae bacterium]|nr:rRNA pseudouridine synthase [Chlorobiaceae bacterium]MBA4308738.1 rRNA pseudouridine synthase [Chlorobiaceae bacterium]